MYATEGDSWHLSHYSLHAEQASVLLCSSEFSMVHHYWSPFGCGKVSWVPAY
jgi:hypothetical protein